MRRVYFLLPVLLLIMICCPLPAYPEGIYFGQAKKMGNGMAWTWVKNDQEGKPVSLGITFTEAATSGLPKAAASGYPTIEFELPLPAGASVPPYTHAVVNWNPHGHIPPGVYDVPHFDFHFYMVAPADRYKITAKGDDIAISNKKPPPEYVPQGYILPEGTQEPRMGSHWIDPSWPELNKKPFSASFIYGSYNGEMTFLEPMASITFLKTKPTFTSKVKLPAAYKKRGYYPTAYSVKYDPERKEYSVALEGLTYR